MPLSADPDNQLHLHLAVLRDRSEVIVSALDAVDDGVRLSADELDAIADRSVEVIDAAQAIEILCARAARGARTAEACCAPDPSPAAGV